MARSPSRRRHTLLVATCLGAALVPSALQARQAEPDRLRIDPPEVTIPVDGSTIVTVRAGATDAVLEPGALQWLSADDGVATVENGRITAVAPGEVRIAVRGEGGIGFVIVTVPELPLHAITVEPALEEVPSGGSAPLEVRGFNRLGQPVSAEGARFESLDPEIASVDAVGRVYGRAPGDARIRVAVAGLDATRVVRVVQPRGEPALTPATAEARTGDVVRFTTGDAWAPAWSVEGVGARIEAEESEGVFVAEEPGTYVVTARIGADDVQTAVIEVAPREYEAELVKVGRGAISEHHSGDMWVFEGVDGRDYVYVGTYLHDWMKVFDVTDAANPVLTDSLRFDARRINDIKIHPNARVGIATREGASNRRNGIVMLDLSEPAHPTILSEYTATVTGGVHNVWIDGERDLVYAAHNGTSSIHILDISDPANVTEVGRWGLPKRTKTLHDVIVQDGYLYASYWNDGILMLDVGAGSHGGTPTEPVEVSRFAYPIGNTHVAWRAGRYLFIGDEIFPPGFDASERIDARGYIHVVDYADPENPVEVATYEVPEAGVHNIWIEGDRMYLGYYQAGLRVVDISGELRGDLYAQGREVASILTTDGDTKVPNWPMAWGAQIHKGRIYSSDLNSGIWITELKEQRVVF